MLLFGTSGGRTTTVELRLLCMIVTRCVYWKGSIRYVRYKVNTSYYLWNSWTHNETHYIIWAHIISMMSTDKMNTYHIHMRWISLTMWTYHIMNIIWRNEHIIFIWTYHIIMNITYENEHISLVWTYHNEYEYKHIIWTHHMNSTHTICISLFT